MRQGPNNRRARGRNNPVGNRRNSLPNRNQTFDSSGPDVRIRGNAYQVHEKYLALARDASASGDRVTAENYLQHAEHYFRIINSINEAHQNAYQQQQPSVDTPREASHENAHRDNGGRTGRENGGRHPMARQNGSGRQESPQDSDSGEGQIITDQFDFGADPRHGDSRESRDDDGSSTDSFDTFLDGRAAEPETSSNTRDDGRSAQPRRRRSVAARKPRANANGDGDDTGQDGANIDKGGDVAD